MHVPPALMILASLVGAAFVLAWRHRESQRAVTLRSIVIPPLGMSTGFAMFVVPQTRVPLGAAIGAFLLGALVLSWPLVRTSTLHVEGDAIVMRRSKAFLFILLGLVAVRLVLRAWVETLASPLQTGALFYLIAFGMIVVWRGTMLARYRALVTALRRS
ncbi:MAG: cytochrome c biogenesis protein CcdC [Myxococcales bacterium]|nr:cytochrome c biogenesis protein CcdC [Myxococcales bacterium]